MQFDSEISSEDAIMSKLELEISKIKAGINTINEKDKTEDPIITENDSTLSMIQH